MSSLTVEGFQGINRSSALPSNITPQYYILKVLASWPRGLSEKLIYSCELLVGQHAKKGEK